MVLVNCVSNQHVYSTTVSGLMIACMCASVMIDRLMQLMHASRAVHASHAE